MLRALHEVLCATRRHRILLGAAAAILPLVVILILLEISYREQAAREVPLTVTGTLESSPPIGTPKLRFDADHPRSIPLAGPISPLAPPAPMAEAQPAPAEAPQAPPQGAAVSRDPVPLPRSRPNRF